MYFTNPCGVLVGMLLNKRVILGFIVAPPVAPAIYYFLISWPIARNTINGTRYDAFLITLFIGIPIAYLITLVIGIPTYLLLRRLDWLNGLSIAIASGTIAASPMLFAEIVNGTIVNYTMNKLIIDISYFFCGVVVGIIFWFIAIRGTTNGDRFV